MSLTNYRGAMESFFDDFYSMMPALSHNLDKCPGLRYPKYNMEVFPDKYVYAFDVPGVKKEELTISESNGVVTVKGTRSQQVTEEKPHYKYTESRYGSFSRSFTVEDDGSCESMNAALNDGVLRVTVPRKENTQETASRSVSIQ